MATGSGYSPVVPSGDGGVEVELDQDHPGFADPAYRRRRNDIAALSVNWLAGEPVPFVEYTEAEHGVWRIVSHELSRKHEKYACREFLHGREALALPTDHIPQLDEVSEHLVPITGFDYAPVAGLAPLREFYGAFAGRRFFSTQYIRHHSVPLYTPEPDIVHEVIGHANQLASPKFAAVCEEVGRAVGRSERAETLAFLSKVFWFTLEFGVVFEDGSPQAYGAGILSSFGELDVFRKADLRPFDFAAMGSVEYDITRYQPLLYAAESFDRLIDDLMDFYRTYDDEARERLLAASAVA